MEYYESILVNGMRENTGFFTEKKNLAAGAELLACAFFQQLHLAFYLDSSKSTIKEISGEYSTKCWYKRKEKCVCAFFLQLSLLYCAFAFYPKNGFSSVEEQYALRAICASYLLMHVCVSKICMQCNMMTKWETLLCSDVE